MAAEEDMDVVGAAPLFVGQLQLLLARQADILLGYYGCGWF